MFSRPAASFMPGRAAHSFFHQRPDCDASKSGESGPTPSPGVLLRLPLRPWSIFGIEMAGQGREGGPALLRTSVSEES